VSEYYSRNLSAARLKHAYDIASPRVKRYLDAELDHVMTKIRSDDRVIELGCGYGRILKRLAAKARFVIGVDTSIPTLELAKETLRTIPNCLLSRMNAARLGFQDQVFDCVVCIQNGISAFHVDQQALVSETVRVTRPGGIVVFSSYSDKFWKHRLEWFERQSEAGLLGEIDYEKTKDGTIVCKDGFTATTVREEDFLALTAHLGAQVLIVEVDESSLFCEITLPDSR
jgi:ubiquinone/menaquinone biosynthesis C-methylase UbiE